MSQAKSGLERFPAIDHMVLLRVYDQEDRLRALVPNLPPHGDALRVLHGVQDRDGRITPPEAKRGLEAMTALGIASDMPCAQVLRHAAAGKAHRLHVIASPVAGLLGRIAQRKGSREDTDAFFELLNAGDVRAAEKVDGRWQPQPYVIDGILNFFAAHDSVRMGPDAWDKVPLRIAGATDAELAASGVRYAPGARVRTGCYIGPGTVIMSQAFVNVGAWIAGEGVMVDVATRVASCAQVGRGVKLGAGTGIEGILEPAGRLPSIIEDHAKIGAMCEVSGIVGEGAVLASGVVMASGKRIFDEATGEVVAPLSVEVGGTVYQVPVIPPYRLAVGGSLLSESGRFATDAVILKPGDLRDTDTLKHFERQGILYL
jgi:2,3,4,5-tetrahydropyridine-2,6-dicarboxylate N-succinyltransferase